jgi:ribose transport system permease protein
MEVEAPVVVTRKMQLGRTAREILATPAWTRLLALVLLCALVALTAPVFLRTQNIINMVRQASLLLIMAIGMTTVILTGGIDLSMGSVLTLSSVVGATVLKIEGLPIWVGIVAGLAVGLSCGLVNGVMVAWVKLPPFIATYGMMWVAQGLAFIVLQGNIITGFPKDFLFFGGGNLFGLPMPIVLMLGVLIVVHVLLSETVWGAHIYAVGGNAEAARRAGIDIAGTLLRAYAVSGLLAAFAGLIFVARLNAAEAGTGEPLLLQVIAMVCIGGVSLFGGEGSVLGSILGALIVTVIGNAMNLWGVSTNWQPFVIGALIIIAVLVDVSTRQWRK